MREYFTTHILKSQLQKENCTGLYSLLPLEPVWIRELCPGIGLCHGIELSSSGPKKGNNTRLLSSQLHVQRCQVGSPARVFTSWKLANTTYQRHLFPFVGELVNQHTTKMRRKGWEHEEPWGSNYQGMSIHNQKDSSQSGSLVFFCHLKQAHPNPALTEENSRATLSCQPALRRGWGVPVTLGWGHRAGTGASQINSCWEPLSLAHMAGKKLDFNVLNRQKKIPPCSLLLPFLGLPAGIFLSLIMASWSGD